MKKHSKEKMSVEDSDVKLESLPQPEYMGKYWDEYKKAIIRIYGDQRQTLDYRFRLTMEWIIKFAQLGLESLSEGDWSNLAYEIACFTELGTGDYPMKTQGKLTSQQDWFFLASPGERPPAPTVTTEQMFWTKHLPSRQTIKGLREVCLKHIIELLVNGDTSFVIPEAKVRVSKITTQVVTTTEKELYRWIKKYDKVEEIIGDSDGSRSFVGTVFSTDRGWKHISAKTPLAVFGYHLSDILAKFALLIFQCPECKTIFLASRSNKQFCSVRCQSRHNMRKYRNTPPERIGKKGRPTGTGKGKVKEVAHGKKRK